jgi:glycosyltransferase involved in cell wall biosynthesis
MELTAIEKVDVIVPTKNDLEAAKMAVESISRQKYPINQCIIVDDGSDIPVSLEDFMNITNLNVVVIRTSGVGLAAARNIGLEKSSAKFVAFLDADDLWLPNKISNQVKKMSSYPGAVGVCSGYKLVDFEGRILRTSKPKRRLLTFDRLIKNKVTMTGSASSVMVKNDIIKSIQGFDSKLRYAEDMDMWLRLSLIGPFVPVRKIDVVITSNPFSMQRSLSDISRAEKEMIVKLEILEKFAAEKRNVRKQMLATWANLIALDYHKVKLVQAFIKENRSSHLVRNIKAHPIEGLLVIFQYILRQKIVSIKTKLLNHLLLSRMMEKK